MTENFESANEKRIFNTIWNSSENYDYFPDFVGSDVKGNPDFYFNIIIGLAAKYYGRENLDGLFKTWETSFRAGTFDFLTRMALEDLVYKKEVSKRPVLKKLRKYYAENFFLDQNDLYRRKFALQSPLLFNIQSQKMRDILNIKDKDLKKKEKEIYQRLIFPQNISFLDLKTSLLDIYKEFFNFDPKKKGSTALKFLGKNLSRFSFQPFEKSIKPAYFSTEKDLQNLDPISSFYFSITKNIFRQKDEKIEAAFGKSLFSKEENNALRIKYCKGADKKSRLWYTKADSQEKKKNTVKSDIERLAIERNKKKFKENRLIYNKQIKDLARQIKSSLKASLSSYKIIADHGDLIGSLARKSQLPNENHIFSVKTLRESSSMSIDLLLDGSASLLGFQEDIAIQAYILAKSLEECNIPLRITAYCSVEDYTILTILKDFDDSPSQDDIFSYHAQGRNRDGLAYKAFGTLLEDVDLNRHLLLIMTDSNPRDLKALYTDSFGPNKSYEGQDALFESKKELDKIRKKGLDLAAIINTKADDDKNQVIKNSRYLYKNKFATISSALNFSAAASRLIKKEIGKIERKN
jgi:hypothetical protein